jgi:hypothetical protein
MIYDKYTQHQWNHMGHYQQTEAMYQWLVEYASNPKYFPLSATGVLNNGDRT